MRYGLNYDGKTKEEIIKAEKRKLAGIYTRLDKKTKRSVDSLVDEAAFMAASLYELRKIIDEKDIQKNTRMELIKRE